MIHVLLSGGSGTRLWPLSRLRMPKQYLPLVHGRSLFEDTLERHQGFCSGHLIVTNATQFALAQRQAGPRPATYVLESVGRNTAPAIAMACHTLDPECIVLVTPSDHLIRDREAYRHAVEKASELAEQGFLVTFGIEPAYPETGFGYIQAQGNVVTAFKEKPDQTTAQAYLDAGGYYWNAGIFCFKAGVYLEELKHYAPDLHKAVLEASSLNQGPDPAGCFLPSLQEMMGMTDISIDYAVLERSDRVRVVPCSIGWSDLGSFDALYPELEMDSQGNTLTGQSLLPIRSHNNLLLHYGPQVLVTQEVDNLLVVTTPDALYIGQRGRSQGLREVVKEMQSLSPDLLESYAETATSWGSAKVLEQNQDSLVVTLTVNIPGQETLRLGPNELKEHPRIQKILNQWGDINVSIQCCNIENNKDLSASTQSLATWSFESNPAKKESPSRILVLLKKGTA